MNKNEYAKLSAAEQTRYDGHKDYVEKLNEQLPSTKLGFAARSKARDEKRLKTYREANPKK